ncbi:MAG TPA: M24 family metallopeptidase [Rhizomicrobium sp.]|jgi:Xaa-Pro aminopeptidase
MSVRESLQDAEARGMALFDAIEQAGLIVPGKTEAELDAEIYILAKQHFDVDIHWHRRIVRAGPNTVCIFADDPPVHKIAANDIVYLDLGPVFAASNQQWEADIGRSYALGHDADKQRLVADLPRLFDIVKAHYDTTPDITGAQLYAFAQQMAREAGWLFGGTIAGHIIGEFPHAQRVPGDRERHRIASGNPRPMRDPDANGNERHWILEIHLVDPARQYGGFYERLL